MQAQLRAAGVCFACLAVVFSLSLVGCGKGGSHVSGNVTFKGQPVPQGSVTILPDAKAGNSGPTGYAEIRDGVYDTAKDGGRPGTAGKVIFRVEGIDPNPPPNAGPDITTTLLLSGYEVEAELPGSASVKDIDVPAEAANRKPQPPENPGFINP